MIRKHSTRGTWRPLGVLTAAIAILSLTAGCSAGAAPSESSERTTIKVGVTPGFSSGTWLKENTAFFNDRDFDVEFIDFNQTADMIPALQAGSIDFFECGVPPAILLAAKYPDMRYLGAALYDNFTLDVAADSDIQSLDDLEGKKVAVVSPASQQWVLVNAALEKSGVDPKSVEFVFTQPTAMASLLQNGEVDAVAVWAPFGSEALRTKQAKTIATAKELYASVGGTGRWLADGIFTSTKVLNEKPEAVEAMKAAFDEFLRIGNSDPASIAKAWAAGTGLDLAAAEFALESNYVEFPSELVADPANVKSIWDVYASVGLVEGSVPSALDDFASAK